MLLVKHFSLRISKCAGCHVRIALLHGSVRFLCAAISLDNLKDFENELGACADKMRIVLFHYALSYLDLWVHVLCCNAIVQ